MASSTTSGPNEDVAAGRCDPPAGSSPRSAAPTLSPVQLLALLLVAEVILLAWVLVGQPLVAGRFMGIRPALVHLADTLAAIRGKRWAAFTAIMLLVGLDQHVRRHRAAYGAVRIAWPIALGQLLSFAGVLGCASWLAGGGRSTALGSTGEIAVGSAVAVAWLLFSLLLVAPGAGVVREILSTMLGFGLFAFAAWHAGTLTMGFWQATGGTTMRLVEMLLAPLAGGPVVRPAAFTIGTPAFAVEVTESCGGFHGIGLVTALLAGYLWWFRDGLRFPQSLLLVPVGIALMWLANVLRITALVLVGIWISPDVAVQGFHSAAGWIAFLTVGLGLIWSTSRMPFFTRPHPGHVPDTAASSRTATPAGLSAATRMHAPTGPAAAPSSVACIVPFLALMAVTILTRAFTAGFDWLYPLRVVAVAAALWRLRHDLPWRTFRIRPVAVAIGVATFAVWMALVPTAAAGTGDDPHVLAWPWSMAWLVVRVVGAAVTVPIAEELFFRGFVMRRCIGPDVDAVPVGQFTWLSFLLSSVAFGVLHGDAWVAGTLAGMLFALAVYTRRSLDDAIVAHATTNALLSGYVVATQSWGQWG